MTIAASKIPIIRIIGVERSVNNWEVTALVLAIKLLGIVTIGSA
jgi:hypothetical protein